LTYPVMKKGRVLYFIQAAILLHQADMSLERLRDWLLVLIPTTLALTSLIGWFLASLILKPIDKMIRQARTISESSLHERLDVPNTGDELTRLAVTFNQLLDRFEKGFKRLRQFSAAASHELRTPLTVIKGEMELALLKPRSEDEYRRVLQTQVNVVNDMVHVVEQLLAVAHAEDGDLAVNWESFDLRDLVRAASQTYTNQADAKAIMIAVHADVSVRIKGEKILLERLIANLLENALRHTPVGGRVTMELTLRASQAQLIVTDTGKGIAEEEMSKIFHKFFDKKRASGSSASTGIGLGLCRWIAELHKGVIEAGNVSGAGARFTVTLPIF
jgi:heavy metal sensor kinase